MRSASSRLLFVSLLLAACGSEPPPTVPTDGGRRDAQVPDGGGPIDGGEDDASEPDASPPPDGGGDAGPNPLTCRADPSTDVFTLATDTIGRVRDVGVAAGATRLAVAWSAREGGFENVWLAEIPATGAGIVAAEQVTTGTALQRDPAIVANGAGWILAWYGNPDADFDVYAVGWEAGRVVTGGSIQRLTSRAGRDDAPALLALATGAIAGWIETRGATMDQRVPVVRMLSTTAAPTAAQRNASTSTAVPSLVLAPRTGGFSLGWVRVGSTMPDALLQPLDANGEPAGEPHVLTTEHNADGSIDLATDEGGGAAVFGTTIAGLRSEVRARLIDGSGMPAAGTSEQVITLAPDAGRDATIAPIAGGYVIAYRALGATPMLRLDLRDSELGPVGTLDVVPVSATGGRVTVRVSGESRIIVGWADVDTTAGTTAIRAARVRCD